MNEFTAHPTKTVLVLVVTVAAISMLRSVFNKDKRPGLRWVRQATTLAAAFLLLWCVGTFYILAQGASLRPGLISKITLVKTVFVGMGAGMLIALLMSGTLTKRKSQVSDKPG